MPVMVHPELPDVRRAISASSFEAVWSARGWVLETEQPDPVAEPTGDETEKVGDVTTRNKLPKQKGTS